MNTRKVLCFNPMAARSESFEALKARGWEVFQTANLDDAKHLIETHDFNTGMVLLDSPEQGDLLQINDLVSLRYAVEWVALLSPEALQSRTVCQLISRSFYDYHTLPFDPERLQIVLGHAHGMADVMKRIQFQAVAHGDEEIVGCDMEVLKLLDDIRKVALVDAPVLITGESGTGKELTARTIHRRSPRADQSFIAINCGALPPSLMQSELFGYEKGAFAGAHRSKPGSIETAAGGTLFLDEVGDLSLDLQSQLLGFLKEKAVRRVGGAEAVPVDVRVIAASQSDLREAVAEGRFLDELYQRLAVLNLELPPLRDRAEDVELLARYYLELFVNDKHRHVRGFSPEAIRAMQQYDWPGNIRELVNRIRRGIVMCEGDLMTPADLGLSGWDAGRARNVGQTMTLEEAKAEAEREIIQLTLRATENNISRAARQLAVSRMTLYRLMDKHHIRGSLEQRHLSS
jgi:DNA-binding NtrC family response regulator